MNISMHFMNFKCLALSRSNDHLMFVYIVCFCVTVLLLDFTVIEENHSSAQPSVSLTKENDDEQQEKDIGKRRITVEHPERVCHSSFVAYVCHMDGRGYISASCTA